MHDVPGSFQAATVNAPIPRTDQDPGDLGWWLTGGVSLLAWTGFALLLTAA